MSSVLALFLHGRFLFAIFAWVIAAAWLSRVIPALWMLPRVPNLLKDADGSANPCEDPAASPSVTVIVPAKDEAIAIERSLRSLVDCDYLNLQVVAVDDRSTDATGRLMDEIASLPESHGRLRVLHVTELPDGWLGKPHAMAMAAEDATSEWLLFTDADVIFDPRAIRLAVQYAEQSGGDHMVLYPTLILRGVAEKMLIGFFQSVSALAGRPWKIADPKATRDYIGVGAFNLIRRPVYEALGGYAELRMEVLEDMRLGFRAKRAGYAQRVAFGKDLVRIRWAESAWGILNNLTKNLYSTFRFRTSLLLAACVGMFVMCLTPFVALFFPGPAQWAGIVTLFALLLLNLHYWKLTDIPPVYLALFPIATLLFVSTLLRSMILVLWRGGVLWRGTLYPLKELRRQAGPLW
ncbi:MAG TPA: glycosyltransferase [Acidobacteriaceae bacterium]|nr:glycosyltransferase [Acidobacteriaceae bacterium]